MAESKKSSDGVGAEKKVPKATSYTVKKNDSLESIAKEFYNNPYNTQPIISANKLPNEILFVGQHLIIPNI